MNKIYSFRLDLTSRNRLQQLADETYRNPAQLLRLLIDLASENPHLLPNVSIVSRESTIPAIRSVKNDDEEG